MYCPAPTPAWEKKKVTNLRALTTESHLGPQPLHERISRSEPRPPQLPGFDALGARIQRVAQLDPARRDDIAGPERRGVVDAHAPYCVGRPHAGFATGLGERVREVGPADAAGGAEVQAFFALGEPMGVRQAGAGDALEKLREVLHVHMVHYCAAVAEHGHLPLLLRGVD